MRTVYLNVYAGAHPEDAELSANSPVAASKDIHPGIGFFLTPEDADKGAEYAEAGGKERVGVIELQYDFGVVLRGAAA